ncbi:nucleotidyltransferase domain-containing protein [Janthinobacterium sp. LM6]|uniref:nucleotidyltransferase domain-containing protein n=1 Tax=Janthinobacterium sp. LM6 TaxID=1938606 RepID=UPI00209ABDA7|nr:nucleotidyltransferase domain-containing protein [Janthinobacterium sp. LM6]
MIPEEIRVEIMRRLAAVEKKEGVRILMAIESGSRARDLPRRTTTSMCVLSTRARKTGI